MSSQSVVLLAYPGTVMLSQYYKEVGFSMLFSAINEVNILQDPVTQEPLSQAHWPTVQEYWGTEVGFGSGGIINLGLKNMSYCRRIMKMLFQNSCSAFLM